MVVEFAGRQVEITPAVRARSHRRIEKLARVMPGITHVRVILSAEKRGLRAEVTVRSPLADLVANERAASAAAALGAVFDTLAEQAKRGKGKRRESPRRIPVRVPTAAAGASVPGVVNAALPSGVEESATRGPRLIRSRKAPRRMTSADAASLAQGSEDGVVVYRDAGSGRVSVIYRRHDGNLGLVEAES